MHKGKLILSSVLAVVALSAVVATSASAFSWWVGPTSKSSEELPEGSKLVFNAASTVTSPFTLKWFKAYEVRCAAATFNELFILGRVGLGAEGIDFESCTVAKPAGYKVIGGQITTSQLTGEIKPVGSKVEFSLKPTLPDFAVFELEGELGCLYQVSVLGTATGDLSAPSKLAKQKTLQFKSKGLSVLQIKNCGVGAAPAKEKRKKHPKEEGEGSVEGNKGNLEYSSEPSFWSAH
jgi:hypothetical protein